MQTTRRELFGALARPAAAVALAAALDPEGTRRALAAVAARPGSPEELAGDESFWFEIQQAFTVDRSVVNLNNGGVSPSPAVVQAAQKKHLDYSNTMPPPVSLWQVLEPQRETVRARLARTFGCDPEEIALVRNASEGLQTCQFGFDLQRGDEVLTTNQDYPRMILTFEQRARREGIVLKQFSIPVPAEDDDEVVERFRKNITPKTKLILMCHVVNLTGQILPVKKVVSMARERGIPVIVDGAHSFAHFGFKHEDLGCDYYATSLHKWLFAPHGTGMLYVRRDKIRNLWPLMAAPAKLDSDIRKFEEIGTHPSAQNLAIAEALTFHEGIGIQRKEARLRYLRDRWAKRLLQHDRVRLHTSLAPGKSCGLANVEIVGEDPVKLAEHFWKKHHILVTPIVHAEFRGLRITPSVYTTLDEIDRFSEVMESVIEKGLPA
ncbi:MAG TPA: aminotransferase class V-fold PLP-dependent enzyme [Thermoanaerobaculia bacterium]|nr:aminotransferase class V-fold PLP-dependent enzyme [Thermoanaerobaculia bacterium]